MRIPCIIALTWAVAGAAAAAPAPGERLNFLSCPQIHDTTPNCWTADYQGETYYIGAQRGPTESYPPQMKHQILVEGVVGDGPRICGGIPVKPVRLSVMPEIDLKCDSPVLPGDGLTAPTLPPRAPLVSRPRDVVGGIGSFMRSDPPQPPYTVREFRIDFDFGSDLLTDQMQKRVIEVLTYAKAANAKAIAIKGYSATTLLTNGRRLAETDGLGEQRARKVARILANFGASEPTMAVAWAESTEPADGVGDADRRRVTVIVQP
jgi:outer membrane protein OmpA-like peptidoglycan-associated protein